MVIVALFTIAKTWTQCKCPSVDEWVKKMWCIHTHTHTYTHTMNYLSVIRKNEIMSFAVTWMHLAMIILSEVTQEDKYYMISLTCEIYNMTQMNLSIEQ